MTAGQRPLTVWVVEDNRVVRERLAELIREQPDMRCPIAVDACEEFLVALDSDEPPDVVLMDLGLPGRSGIEGIARLTSRSPGSKAIVLTIHEESDKVFEAICAGASGYLLKPSAPEEILESVRRVQRGAAPINAYIGRKILDMFSRIPPPTDAAGKDYGLTDREREVLQHLVRGLTMRQVADELGVSFHTVNNHVRNIYRKLQVSSRSGAVAKALREDLL